MRTLGFTHLVIPRALAALALALALGAAPAHAHAPVADGLAPRVGPGVATMLPLTLDGDRGWPRLAPRLFVGDHGAVWRDTLGVTRIAFLYGSSAGAGVRLRDRVDLAQGLLLPGRWSAYAALAHVLGRPERVHLIGPTLGIDAKVVSWRRGSGVGQLGVRDDLGFYVPDRLGLTLSLSRALNLLGPAERRVRMLPPIGGDGVWVTYMGSSAACRLPPHDLYVTATYHQFLGDSKFAFPSGGRRVFTLGLMKGLGAEGGLAHYSDGAAD